MIYYYISNYQSTNIIETDLSREDINATNNTSLTDLDKITSSSSKEIELKEIPEKYRKEAAQRGRIERLDYETSGIVNMLIFIFLMDMMKMTILKNTMYFT